MLNPFTYTEVVHDYEVRYLTGVKSAGFQSQLVVSCMSSHTDKL